MLNLWIHKFIQTLKPGCVPGVEERVLGPNKWKLSFLFFSFDCKEEPALLSYRFIPPRLLYCRCLVALLCHEALCSLAPLCASSFPPREPFSSSSLCKLFPSHSPSELATRREVGRNRFGQVTGKQILLYFSPGWWASICLTILQLMPSKWFFQKRKIYSEVVCSFHF